LPLWLMASSRAPPPAIPARAASSTRGKRHLGCPLLAQSGYRQGQPNLPNQSRKFPDLSGKFPVRRGREFDPKVLKRQGFWSLEIVN
jgi:hypothetical protein